MGFYPQCISYLKHKHTKHLFITRYKHMDTSIAFYSCHKCCGQKPNSCSVFSLQVFSWFRWRIYPSETSPVELRWTYLLAPLEFQNLQEPGKVIWKEMSTFIKRKMDDQKWAGSLSSFKHAKIPWKHHLHYDHPQEMWTLFSCIEEVYLASFCSPHHSIWAGKREI